MNSELVFIATLAAVVMVFVPLMAFALHSIRLNRAARGEGHTRLLTQLQKAEAAKLREIIAAQERSIAAQARTIDYREQAIAALSQAVAHREGIIGQLQKEIERRQVIYSQEGIKENGGQLLAPEGTLPPPPMGFSS